MLSLLIFMHLIISLTRTFVSQKSFKLRDFLGAKVAPLAAGKALVKGYACETDSFKVGNF